MDCLANIVKYILYIFNLIFVICGILLIVLGSLMLKNIGDFSDFPEANTETIPILIIILGCIVFVVAFFGCCGSIRESICCTTTYAVFMFILFALQVALVVWIFVKRQQFLNTMGEAVDKAWEKNDSANGYPMNALQIALNCCGKTSYLNYGGNVPSSCCGTMTGECPQSVYVNKPGCRDTFVDFWATNTNIIRYAGIGVALVELVAFTFACCLASSIRKSSHRM
ncbi:23 kDa integral membrane protein-like [Lucilia cuprina]|uniref:23 kDa integral membrane protein-like n=1 Tax=Lucilia cuprina TaxID=7375 RepID=UPI001F06406D|nr:23 kDa integral membrane protein-like [Lucilia cuprina]